MLTERMCMANQTLKYSSIWYYPGIHLFRECIFLDDNTLGTFSTTPANKVTFADCSFRVLPTEDLRVVVDSPHLIEEGEEHSSLFKERCVYVPKSKRFTVNKEDTALLILAAWALPTLLNN